MKGWALIAAVVAFAAWTAGVAYFADQHGYGRAEQKCQEERDDAAARQKAQEEIHADEARQLESDLADATRLARQHRAVLARIRADHPRECRVGAERLRHWNAVNAGASVSGEPPAGVRGELPAGDG